ncbi:MAG: serine hydrolase [Bacteriovoracaceae bacterium]|nr:serine hydrolase [Bacteriovoracaceae bacterium]
MKDTSFNFATKSADIALPYSRDKKLHLRDTKPITLAAGLTTTVADISKWLRFHLNRGKTSNDVQLISDENLSHISRRHNIINTPIPFLLQNLEWLDNKTAYGLGLFIGEVNGHKALFHPGYLDGYSSMMVIFPELDLGISVLTNQHLSALPGKLSKLIYERVTNCTVQVPSDAFLAEDEMKVPHTTNNNKSKPTLNFDKLLGTYEDSAFGIINIEKLHASTDYCIDYYGHKWPIKVTSNNTFEFLIETFGMQIPMTATVCSDSGSLALAIPMSLEDRVPPRKFNKV